MDTYIDSKYMLESSMDHTVKVGLYSRVVLKLMEGLEDHGFELYTDNYYTSPQLFLTLYKKGVNCCGTAT